MGIVRRTGVRVYRWRAAWREALALRCAAGSDGPGGPPDPLGLLGQGQLVVAGMPQPVALVAVADQQRSEEQPSELQSLMRNSYAVFCLKTKKREQTPQT